MERMNIFKRIKRYLKAIKPLILSHHPDCEEFEAHAVTVGSKRLCIGCFIGYPTMFISIILIALLNIKQFLPHTWFLYIAVGFSSTFFLSFTALTEIRIIKIIQKILMATGAGFLFWWIFYSARPFIVQLLYFFMIFGILSLILNAYHMYGIYRTCKKCKYHSDWKNCPGFGPLYRFLEENNLPNYLKSMKKHSPSSAAHFKTKKKEREDGNLEKK
jgi:hypothetical protein